MISIEYFTEELNQKIIEFEKYRDNNKKFFRRIYIGQLFLSSITTLFIALSGVYHFLKPASLITSSFVVFLQGWTGYSDFKGLWVAYKSSTTELHIIKSKLEHLTRSSPDIIKTKVIDLYERYIEIIKNNEKNWGNYIGNGEKPTKQNSNISS